MTLVPGKWILRMILEASGSIRFEPVGMNIECGIKMVDHFSPWSLTPQEIDLMNSLIVSYNLKNGYELATGFGVSAVSLGLGFKVTNGKLVTMDSFIEENTGGPANYNGIQGIYPNSDGYLSVQSLIKNMDLIGIVFSEVGWSPDNVPGCLHKHFQREEIDFVFIDGLHTAQSVVTDLGAIDGYLSSRRAIFLHDSQILTSQAWRYIETLGEIHHFQTRNNLSVVTRL